MATSLLALLDDIASVLDDVATLTKVATRKTAGVLGDDLALNAQQVTGVRPDRELPVVWAVGKGSLWNKAILVPAALAISAFAPWAITPLLMIGGLFLCYEGAEKLAHKLLHPGSRDAHREELTRALVDPNSDLVALERERIKGAIRTDFVLSAEIIVITLGVVAAAPLTTRIGALVAISLMMTFGVYGLVAGIVKLDDGGLALTRSTSAVLQAIGRAILAAMPWLMKALSIFGTAAMFLVGGGILTHGMPVLHRLVEPALHDLAGWIATLGNLVFDGVVGMIAGAIVVVIVALVKKLRGTAIPAGAPD